MSCLAHWALSLGFDLTSVPMACMRRPCSCLSWELQLQYPLPVASPCLPSTRLLLFLGVPAPLPDPCPLAPCAETAYVLGNYKTEPCKKPPRLCRQGYACPYYHNSKDRRRSPRKHKYRSFGPRRPATGGRSGREGIMAEATTTVALRKMGRPVLGITGL